MHCAKLLSLVDFCGISTLKSVKLFIDEQKEARTTFFRKSCEHELSWELKYFAGDFFDVELEFQRVYV